MCSSVEPQVTRSWTIAGEDLTLPEVLKVQMDDNLSDNWPSATPVNPGLPRNIGQSAAVVCFAAAKRNAQQKVRFDQRVDLETAFIT